MKKYASEYTHKIVVDFLNNQNDQIISKILHYKDAHNVPLDIYLISSTEYENVRNEIEKDLRLRLGSYLRIKSIFDDKIIRTMIHNFLLTIDFPKISENILDDYQKNNLKDYESLCAKLRLEPEQHFVEQ
tara:strand:+ start:5389 stop:5778 length:390 start_codon:yes stop_codon:yes gene_type:complete